MKDLDVSQVKLDKSINQSVDIDYEQLVEELSIKNSELLNRNRELAGHVQHWRMECKKIMDEKLQLQKENNELLFMLKKKKDDFTKLKKIHNFLKNQIFEVSNKLTSFGEIINEDDANQSINRESFSTIPSNRDSMATSVNVHHVLPMIKGVAMKSPILVVDRANIDLINGNIIRSAKRNKPVRNSGSPQNSLSSRSSETTPNLINSSQSTSQINEENVETNISNSLIVSPKNIRRDPFVSLSRINLNNKVQRNIGNDNNEFSPSDINSKLNVEECLNNSEINIVSQGSPSENKENSFTDFDMIDDYGLNDHSAIISRLECIEEQTEVISSQSLFKSNQENSSIFSPVSPKKRRTYLSNGGDDPLEGTSWRYRNDLKVDNVVDEINESSNYSILENFKKTSTNESYGKENKSEELLSPTYQSTPKCGNVTSLNFTESIEENNIASPSMFGSSTNTSIEPKKSNKTENRRPTKLKTSKKLSRVRKSSSPLKKKPSRKSSNTRSSSIRQEESTASDDNSIVTSRSRRIKKVNYKEMSCNTKLRRN